MGTFRTVWRCAAALTVFASHCLLLLAAAESPPAGGVDPMDGLPPEVAYQLLYKEPNDHLLELGEISDVEGSLVRTFFSPAHVKAADTLQEWMREAGMRTWVDGVGNVHGRIDGKDPAAPVLIMGSHYDTVVDAGRYDGAMGIIVPIAAVKALVEQQWRTTADCSPADERVGKCSIEDSQDAVLFDHPFEIIAFSDEEGVRFGSTFLGSRAVAGTLVSNGLLYSKGTDGMTLAEVLEAAGLDGSAEAVNAMAYKPEEVRGYLEVHMEQGPVLESKGVPIGPVSAIAGQTRLFVTMSGVQGHAGTVPMKIRHDSVAGAAEAISWMERRCGGGYHEELHPAAASLTDNDMLVCSTGVISIWPGASNVISGATNFTIDIRSAYDAVRNAAVEDVRHQIHLICERRGLACEVLQQHDAPGVLSDPAIVEGFLAAAKASQPLMEQLERVHQTRPEYAGLAAEAEGVAGGKVPILVSGAGHDALAMADITEIGMVFVRCGNNGVSHSPLELVSPPDVAAVTAAVYKYLQEQLIQK
eukprot:jgi/Tetstr1/462819/TSEL_007769.t1